jgi:2-dehydro-3-deoxyphosphogluconate aldolase / (4S)-4-hydroxy-2-oxoglutarate aldolase
MDIEQFKRLPVLGILRGGDRATIAPLVEAAIDAGLETLEITMNTPDAPALIQRAVAVAGDRLCIGAGTVLSLEDLDAAVAAGATFVVMPTLVAPVVADCARQGIPTFPGALTPQEIHDAWSAGAAMVKVFPAGFFGPEYFKEIKGPFADIELLACGGVNEANLAAYFANGASAVAFGASIFRKEWLAAGDFASIGAAIRGLLQAYRRQAV